MHLMLKTEGERERATKASSLRAGWCRRAQRNAARGDGGAGPRPSRRGFAPVARLLWRVLARGSQPGSPRGLLLAWPRWEHFSQKMWPTRGIPGVRYDVLRVRFVAYKGATLVLPDGTEIRRGMSVGELHCQNQTLLDLARKGVSPYCAARDDLRYLARWISQPDFGANVQALFGITLLGNAAARLGFSVRARPVTLRARLDRMFMTGLLLLYTVDGLARLDRGATARFYPGEIWLSRRELLKRYLNPAQSEQHAVRSLYLNQRRSRRPGDDNVHRAKGSGVLPPVLCPRTRIDIETGKRQ
jgi:hypothetical protein